MKFKYGDKVRVIEGFYEGLEGELMEIQRLGKTVRYLVSLYIQYKINYTITRMLPEHVLEKI